VETCFPFDYTAEQLFIIHLVNKHTSVRNKREHFNMSEQKVDTSLLIAEITANLHRFKHYASRVFHGRGHQFSGFEKLNIEWYPPYIFVQNFDEALPIEVSDSLKVLFERETAIEAILIQNREWPELETKVLCERCPTELPINQWSKLNDKLRCQVTLGKNRNTGVFLDMRAGWDWVQENATNKKVLNLFSYTSVFSLFALEGGANSVINMDMAAGVLKTAQKNHQKNNLSDGKAAFYKRDILKSAQQFSKMGPYELIIIDPPPYQKKSFRGWQDYEKLLLRCEKSLNPGGQILTCLNNPQITQQEFTNSLKTIFPQAISFTVIQTSEEIKEVDQNKGLKLVSICFS